MTPSEKSAGRGKRPPRSPFLQSVQRFFDQAARHTGLSAGLLRQIKHSNSVYRVRFPVEDDDGAGAGQPAEPRLTYFLYDEANRLRFLVEDRNMGIGLLTGPG